MTGRRVHGMDSDLRGYDDRVNKFIDWPYAWLGNKHRVLFHTPEESMFIGYTIDGIDGAIGGLSHLMLDNIKDKETKNALEMMAVIHAHNKKQMKLKKGKILVTFDRESLKKSPKKRYTGEILSITYADPPSKPRGLVVKVTWMEVLEKLIKLLLIL